MSMCGSCAIQPPLMMGGSRGKTCKCACKTTKKKKPPASKKVPVSNDSKKKSVEKQKVSNKKK